MSATPAGRVKWKGKLSEVTIHSDRIYHFIHDEIILSLRGLTNDLENPDEDNGLKSFIEILTEIQCGCVRAGNKCSGLIAMDSHVVDGTYNKWREDVTEVMTLSEEVICKIGDLQTWVANPSVGSYEDEDQYVKQVRDQLCEISKTAFQMCSLLRETIVMKTPQELAKDD